jgi:hypothetical protein
MRLFKRPLFWAALAALTLCGCVPAPYVWRDAGTGCEYLIARGAYSRSITPRLDRDGQQVCVRGRP